MASIVAKSLPNPPQLFNVLSKGQDADTGVFCYANGELRKDRQNDEVLRFVEFWKQRTVRPPKELIFDSKLTTYANLNRLNRLGFQFITLRRRSRKLLDEVARTQPSAWRRVELENASRAYKTPRVLDRRVTLNDYDAALRHLTVADMGHKEPILLLTIQLTLMANSLYRLLALASATVTSPPSPVTCSATSSTLRPGSRLSRVRLW